MMRIPSIPYIPLPTPTPTTLPPTTPGQNAGRKPGPQRRRLLCARGHGADVAVLVDELEVVARQQVGDGGELGPVPGRVVVEFEEGDGEQFHVFGDAEDFYGGRN